MKSLGLSTAPNWIHVSCRQALRTSNREQDCGQVDLDVHLMPLRPTRHERWVGPPRLTKRDQREAHTVTLMLIINIMMQQTRVYWRNMPHRLVSFQIGNNNHHCRPKTRC